jgi:hypothetical protein
MESSKTAARVGDRVRITRTRLGPAPALLPRRARAGGRYRSLVLLMVCAGCDTADMAPDQAMLLMVFFMALGIASAIDRAASKIADAIRDLRDHKVQLDTRSQIDVRVRGDDGKPVRTQAVGKP